MTAASDDNGCEQRKLRVMTTVASDDSGAAWIDDDGGEAASDDHGCDAYDDLWPG